MIPSIEDIVDMVRHAQCDRKQAIAWLERHVEMARERADLDELRDHFAANALRVTLQINDHYINVYQSEQCARFSYMVADAMLKAREARLGAAIAKATGGAT